VFPSLAVLVIRQGGRGGVCAVVAGCLVGVEFAVSCVCEVGEGGGAVPSSDGNNNLDAGGPALTTSSGGAGSMGVDNTGGCCVGMREGWAVFFILVS
jgi:hypothetical protein